MTFVEALRAVRPLIASEKYYYICHALHWISPTYLSGYAHSGRIAKLLRRHETYEDWVRVHHPSVYEKMLLTRGAFRRGRLQWIDHMIAQEESK